MNPAETPWGAPFAGWYSGPSWDDLNYLICLLSCVFRFQDEGFSGNKAQIKKGDQERHLKDKQALFAQKHSWSFSDAARFSQARVTGFKWKKAHSLDF